jgi:hypothetical protein
MKPGPIPHISRQGILYRNLEALNTRKSVSIGEWIEGVKKEQRRWRREDILTSAIHCNKQCLNPAFATATAQYMHKSIWSIVDRSTKVRTTIQLRAGSPRKSVLTSAANPNAFLDETPSLRSSHICPALPGLARLCPTSLPMKNKHIELGSRDAPWGHKGR